MEIGIATGVGLLSAVGGRGLGQAAGLMVRVRTNRPTTCPKPLRRCAWAFDGWSGINGISMNCYVFHSCLRMSDGRKRLIWLTKLSYCRGCENYD